MAYTRYPLELDAEGQDGNLPGLADKLRVFDPVASLATSISPQELEIPFFGINPVRLPSQGIVRIDDEIVAYQQLEPVLGSQSGMLKLTAGIHRGIAATQAAGHQTGALISWLITSVHFKIAYEAILALQYKVGVHNSPDSESIDYRTRQLEWRMDEGDNAVLADDFVIVQGDINNRYVECRQPIKIPSDFAVLVRGGTIQHSGHDVFVSANNPHLVYWEPGSDLDNLLKPGDSITVVYRATMEQAFPG